MDVVTQGLLGAVAAQALFGRRLPRSAWIIGAAAGLLPDLDVVLRSPVDPRPWMIHHRGFTHSLFFVPFGAALVALPFLAARRLRAEGAWRAVYGAAAVAMATHAPLDALTTYGTPLLWPLTDRRFALDVIGIIDPLFTLALLVGLAWGVARGAMAPARWAIGVALAYALVVGGVQRERAFAAQAELARERGHVIARRRVMPAPLTLVVWRSIYETTDGRVVADGIRTPYLGPARVRRGDGVGLPVVRPGDPLPAAIPDDRREAARDARRVFAWFADGYVVQDPARPDRLLDARYGAATDPAAAFWGIEPAPPGTPLAAAPAGYHWWRAGARRDLARELWATIRGRDPHETALGGARSRSRPGEDADAGRGASGDADPAARRPTESLAAPGSSALAVAP